MKVRRWDQDQVMQDHGDHLLNVSRRVTRSDLAIDKMLLKTRLMLCNVAENGEYSHTIAEGEFDTPLGGVNPGLVP